MPTELSKSALSAPGGSDALTFQGSPENTLGVELELQITDRESGDLSSGAVPILRACAEEHIDGPTAELMQSMLEVKTGICRTVNDAKNELAPALKKVHNIASSMGYDLALGATHPWHRTMNSVVFPAERYESVQDRLAWITYQRVVFGLHVHVGVPSGDIAIAITNMMVQYLPHLLALSASSPFWNGVDTGLASSRAALYRLLPHAGVPRYFRNWKEFRNYYRVMRDCQAIRSNKDIYWDIRPNPELGTVEFRICDMPSSLKITFALVALIRSLVIACQRLIEERPRLRSGDMRRHWIAVENKWLATRYGLKAMYIRSPAGKRRPLLHDLNELIERILPIAHESGDHSFLTALQPLDQLEAGADRQRRLFRESGNWKALSADMASRFADELNTFPRLAAG